jgi:hypothetical protein
MQLKKLQEAAEASEGTSRWNSAIESKGEQVFGKAGSIN